MENNNNKPWYEKVGIWVTIVAGICTILGVSIFKNSKNDDTMIRFESNEIGEHATVIIGDGNTIYGSTESNNAENSQSNDASVSESKTPSVTASYDPNTAQTSPSGVNILVSAETSFPADHVTISATSDEVDVEKDMHGGRYEWYFTANFYIKGTYTVTITAYDSEGNKVSDSFEYVY